MVAISAFLPLPIGTNNSPMMSKDDQEKENKEREDRGQSKNWRL